MTASKSSRARNARSGAQASTARNGGAARNGGTARNGGAARNGGTAGNGSVARNGAAAKNTAKVTTATARNGTAAANRTAGKGPAGNGTTVKGPAGNRTAGKGPAGNGAARNGASGNGRARGAAVRGGSRGRGVQDDLAASTAGTGPAFWLQVTTWVLSLAGLGVSIYLTIAHFTESKLLGCSENGLVNCTKVTTSPQSYVFGIPVAVLGLAFFLAAVALMSPWAWRWGRREVALIRLASVVVGMGFVLYLLYAELFIIGSICLYCTSVHAITFILFGLTMFAVAAWGIPKRQRA